MNNYLYKANNIFLVDCLGALISAFFLGIVLVKCEAYFGMPPKELYALSLIACVFALFSFISYLFIKKNRNIALKTIALANLAYCIITAYMVICFYTVLTTLGFFYFLLEIAIILILVAIELKVAYHNSKQ